MSSSQARIAVVIRNVVWVGIAAHAGFVPMFWLLGQPVLAAFNSVSVALWVAALKLNARGRSNPAMWLIVLEVGAHAVLAVASLGWASGFQYYLIPLIPFVMFNDRLSTSVAVRVSAAVFLTFVALKALAPEGRLDGPVALVQSYANIFIPFLALGLVSVFFRLASTQAEAQQARMAVTDPLTGLFNRRRMDERLREEQARHVETGSVFGVILADVDHFKSINDTLGHDTGDKVLRAIARLLESGLRGQDAAARWGGEEFLLLLPDTQLEGARDVANRLRAAAEAQLKGELGLPRPVTLTFGVSAYRGTASLEECLKAADTALYAGKNAGRNRVVEAV